MHIIPPERFSYDTTPGRLVKTRMAYSLSDRTHFLAEAIQRLDVSVHDLDCAVHRLPVGQHAELDILVEHML